MRINRDESGFTLAETVIALGLGALAIVALLATNDYFTKARFSIEARAAHAELRNRILQKLVEVVPKCAGSECSPELTCAETLRDPAGTPLRIAKAMAPVASAIDETDQVELSIRTKDPIQPDPLHPKELITVISTNPDPKIAPPNDMERRDHLKYQVFLVGNVKTETPTERTYVGAVVLVGHRNIAGLNGDPVGVGMNGPDLRAIVPLTFTAARGDGSLTSCSARANNRPLLQGRHTAQQCVEAGGTPVPTDLGDLCRFSSAVALLPPPSLCPIDFSGDPYTPPKYCYPDPAGEDLLETVPPCPTITVGEDPVTHMPEDLPPPGIAGVPNPTRNRGALFCDFQGLKGATDPRISQCPPPPALPDEPESAWVIDGTFDPTTNLLTCKFLNQKTAHPTDWFCDTPTCTEVWPGPPYSPDTMTPACSCPITQCPNGTLTPPPYVQVSAYPDLRCMANPNAPKLPTTAANVTAKCPSLPSDPNNPFLTVQPGDFPTLHLSEFPTYSKGVTGVSGLMTYVLCK